MDGAGAGFGGVAIWNELIDGVDQFLDIVDFLGTNCYADSFAHNPVLGALFGLTGNRKFLVKECPRTDLDKRFLPRPKAATA